MIQVLDALIEECGLIGSSINGDPADIIFMRSIDAPCAEIASNRTELAVAAISIEIPIAIQGRVIIVRGDGIRGKATAVVLGPWVKGFHRDGTDCRSWIAHNQ